MHKLTRLLAEKTPRSTKGKTEMTAEQPVCEAFYKLAELAGALGIKSINDLPGCWEHAIDNQWTVAMNGHSGPVICSHGASLPGYHCYIERLGTPMGLIQPYGGVLIDMENARDGTTENALISAIDAALSRLLQAEDENSD